MSGGLGVHAAAESVGDAGGDGDDVLGCTTGLAAHDIVARVHAQRVGHEDGLDGLRMGEIGEGDTCRRRLAVPSPRGPGSGR